MLFICPELSVDIIPLLPGGSLTNGLAKAIMARNQKGKKRQRSSLSSIPNPQTPDQDALFKPNYSLKRDMSSDKNTTLSKS